MHFESNPSVGSRVCAECCLQCVHACVRKCVNSSTAGQSIELSINTTSRFRSENELEAIMSGSRECIWLFNCFPPLFSSFSEGG